jgi:hypothetical protein
MSLNNALLLNALYRVFLLLLEAKFSIYTQLQEELIYFLAGSRPDEVNEFFQFTLFLVQIENKMGLQIQI